MSLRACRSCQLPEAVFSKCILRNKSMMNISLNLIRLFIWEISWTCTLCYADVKIVYHSVLGGVWVYLLWIIKNSLLVKKDIFWIFCLSKVNSQAGPLIIHFKEIILSLCEWVYNFIIKSFLCGHKRPLQNPCCKKYSECKLLVLWQVLHLRLWLNTLLQVLSGNLLNLTFNLSVNLENIQYRKERKEK